MEMQKSKTPKSKKNKKPQMLPSLYGVSEEEAVKDLLKSPPVLIKKKNKKKNSQ